MNTPANRKRTTDILEESFVSEQYDQNVLYRAFIQPFTDVGKVLQHGVQKTMAKGLGAVGKAVLHAFAIINPFMSFDDLIRAHRDKVKQKIQSVDQRFADVLARSKFWQDPDFLGITFLMNPGAFIGANLALRAPGPTLDLLGTVLGGSAILDRWRASLHQSLAPRRVYAGAGHSTPSANLGAGDVSYDDVAGAMDVYEEQAQPQGTNDMVKQFAAWVSSPQIQQQLNQSKVIQAIREIPLELVWAEANDKLTFDTFEQLQAKQPKAAEQLLTDLGIDKAKTKDPNTKQQLDTAALELKKKLKSVYLKNLQGIKALNPAAAKQIDATVTQINKM